MALDFPSNPVDGEVFDTYVWNASKGVWQASEEQAAVVITSPVMPATAKNGDLWLNTTTGMLFAYYNDGSSSQWVEVLSSAVPNVNEIMPVGTITQTARISAPTGWLLCEGQAVSRTEYFRLFDAIGTLYGSGDGTTTFNVPNLKGKVPVGKDSTQTEFDALGETGGAKSVTLETTHVPSHTHTFSGTTSTNGLHTHLQGQSTSSSATVHRYVGSGGNSTWPFGTTSNNIAQQNDIVSAGDHTHTFSGTTGTGSGSGTAHQNLQPYIVLNYMIKV